MDPSLTFTAKVTTFSLKYSYVTCILRWQDEITKYASDPDTYLIMFRAARSEIFDGLLYNGMEKATRSTEWRF